MPSGWPRCSAWTGWWRWPGCPGGAPGDQVPHFGAGGWLPYLEGVYQRQWEDQIAPYWSGLARFAAAESPPLRVCLELHPGTCAFNVETFGRVAALGPSLAANLDPSHFFWMGMDGHRVAAALGDRVAHVHGKDTVSPRRADGPQRPARPALA